MQGQSSYTTQTQGAVIAQQQTSTGPCQPHCRAYRSVCAALTVQQCAAAGRHIAQPGRQPVRAAVDRQGVNMPEELRPWLSGVVRQ